MDNEELKVVSRDLEVLRMVTEIVESIAKFLRGARWEIKDAGGKNPRLMIYQGYEKKGEAFAPGTELYPILKWHFEKTPPCREERHGGDGDYVRAYELKLHRPEISYVLEFRVIEGYIGK